ncbi:MAG: outer membrane protein assembly factor BamE domain-containing protein [Pseudomonadota bacterium]
MNKIFAPAMAIVLSVVLAGCASSAKQAPDGGIVGDIPEDSKFAKIEIGMPQAQVYDLIGPPTDTKTYITGKSFIPFYYGSDAARSDSIYKNEGHITFTGGTGFGANSFKVYRIVYDPSEDGYNN